MSGNSGYIDAFYKTPHPVRSHNSTGILFDQDRHMDNLATSLGIQARPLFAAPDLNTPSNIDQYLHDGDLLDPFQSAPNPNTQGLHDIPGPPPRDPPAVLQSVINPKWHWILVNYHDRLMELMKKDPTLLPKLLDTAYRASPRKHLVEKATWFITRRPVTTTGTPITSTFAHFLMIIEYLEDPAHFFKMFGIDYRSLVVKRCSIKAAAMARVCFSLVPEITFEEDIGPMMREIDADLHYWWDHLKDEILTLLKDVLTRHPSFQAPTPAERREKYANASHALGVSPYSLRDMSTISAPDAPFMTNGIDLWIILAHLIVSVLDVLKTRRSRPVYDSLHFHLTLEYAPHGITPNTVISIHMIIREAFRLKAIESYQDGDSLSLADLGPSNPEKLFKELQHLDHPGVKNLADALNTRYGTGPKAGPNGLDLTKEYREGVQAAVDKLVNSL